MNRVKKISRKYVESRPDVDRERAIRSHTRNARRHAIKVKAHERALSEVLARLPHMTKPELVKIAKGLGIRGRSRLTKEGLVQKITEVMS